jgi:hypothetical protein
VYLSLAKIGRIILRTLILLVVLYGLFIYALSPTSQQQTVGMLTSIFGVQLLWFFTWLRRSKIAPIPAPGRAAQITMPAQTPPGRAAPSLDITAKTGR